MQSKNPFCFAAYWIECSLVQSSTHTLCTVCVRAYPCVGVLHWLKKHSVYKSLATPRWIVSQAVRLRLEVPMTNLRCASKLEKSEWHVKDRKGMKPKRKTNEARIWSKREVGASLLATTFRARLGQVPFVFIDPFQIILITVHFWSRFFLLIAYPYDVTCILMIWLKKIQILKYWCHSAYMGCNFKWNQMATAMWLGRRIRWPLALPTLMTSAFIECFRREFHVDIGSSIFSWDLQQCILWRWYDTYWFIYIYLLW